MKTSETILAILWEDLMSIFHAFLGHECVLQVAFRSVKEGEEFLTISLFTDFFQSCKYFSPIVKSVNFHRVKPGHGRR